MNDLKHSLAVWFQLILIVCCLAVSLLTCIKLFRMEASGKQDDSDTQKYVHLGQLYYSAVSDGLSLDDNADFQNYLDEHSLRDSSVLVFCYSNMSCETCTRGISESIHRSIPSAGNSPRVVYVESDYRTKSLFKYPYLLHTPENTFFGLEVEDSQMPCLFIYSNGRISNFMVPDSYDAEAMETYLNAVADRYLFE